MSLLDAISGLTTLQRILVILGLAVVAGFVVRGLRRLGEWVAMPRDAQGRGSLRRHPKFVTLTTLVVSAVTFAIYFGALGLVLREFGVSLTAYFASATVIGLAVGFGSQGLVQDVVNSLTLIFSDILHVGDMVDIAGQTGRIERIGLRFTTLVNLLDQRVHIPNRNIAQINRYRGRGVRAWVDVQLPEGAEEPDVVSRIEAVAAGMRAQHGAILLADPRTVGVGSGGAGGWRFVRIELRLWPGQGALVENQLVKRVVAAMREVEPDYPDWKVTVTYRSLPLLAPVPDPE